MKNIQKQYTDLLEGKMSKANFMRNVRMQFPQYVSPVTSYDDSIKILKGKRILSEAKQPEGVYGHNPSAEVTKYPNFDTVNYSQLIKGMKYELSLMDEITDENLVLAKKKALEALTKDPMAYRELMIANQKAITEMDKDLKMKDVKEDNKVDKANGMKVVKKDAPATANQSKKFTNKVEKVMQMTQTPKKAKGIEKVMDIPGKEKVVALKESILKEFDSYKHEIPENFSHGQRVMTKDKKKVGEVTHVEQDTATVKLDDGTLEHIQLNVLTAKDVPAKEEKVEETVFHGKAPNKPGVPEMPTKEEWDSMSHEDRVARLKNSAAAKYKNVEIRANDDYDTLRKYNPGVLQAMGFAKSPLTVDDDAPAKDFPIKGDIGASAEKFKKTLKEKMKKALEELLYKNKKNGKIQSFDQSHPEDKDIMSDPQFNQVFTKA
jgi:hypothetical protein